jgi:hypothetical protein
VERVLTDEVSRKTWRIKLQDKSIFTSNNNGKEKEKVLADAQEARKKYEKEIWEKLKKGFIYLNPAAKKGEPLMHRFIGSGYTGSMPITSSEIDDSFFISQVIGKFEKEEIKKLYPDGKIENVKTLPAYMNYHIRSLGDKILMNQNHQILALDLKSGEINAYSKKSLEPVSALDVFEERAVWYDEPNIVVYDFAKNAAIFKKSVQCELYGGHSLLCAAAVHNDTLAFCTKSNEITFIDIKTLEERVMIKDEPSYTDKMRFSNDGKYLFLQERYSSWKLKAYDISAKAWETSQEVRYVAFCDKKSLFATLSMNNGVIEIYNGFEKTLTFRAENVVRSAFFAFTKDCLALYSDYGCVSLYKI